MDVTIRFKKTDENGNTYYEDTNGNRIVEVEPSPEEIAAKDEEYYRWVDELNRQYRETERKAKPFLLKSLGNLQKPKARKVLWSPHPNPLPGGEGVVYWAERELCILAGDNGVGKSLMALQVARALVPPPPTPPLEGRGAVADLNSPLTGGDVEQRETEGVFEAEERGGGFGLPTDQNTTHPLPHAKGVSTPPDQRIGCLTTTSQWQGESLIIPPPPAPPLEGRGVIADLNSPLTGGDVDPDSYREKTEGGNKVLYIDFELTEEDFVQRWGGTDVPENFFWAGFNADSEMPQRVPDKIDWLLQNFTTTVKETEANILIIDQPDRLHLSPQKWNEFLTQIKALMRQFNLSVMLVVSNKPRHTGRPCGLNNIPKGNLLIPVADSVIMMCQNQRRTCERYFKVLKNRNRAVAENIEEVDIVELEEYEGVYQVHPWGRQAERSMLPPNAAERKNQQIMQAEKLWNSGLSCLEVAEQMYVAESTVKGWLRPLFDEKRTMKNEKSSPVFRQGESHPLQERDIPRAISPFGGSTADFVSGEGGPQGESRLLHPVIN